MGRTAKRDAVEASPLGKARSARSLSALAKSLTPGCSLPLNSTSDRILLRYQFRASFCGDPLF